MRMLSSPRTGSVRALRAGGLAALVHVLTGGTALNGATTADAWNLFRRGAYEETIALAAAGREVSVYDQEWWRLEIESLLALGRYEEAHATVVEGMQLLRGSLRLRLLGLQTAPRAGRSDELERLRAEVRGMLVSRARSVRSTTALVEVGEAALLFGVEPRLVLENFLRPGRENLPPARDAFLVAGRLALSKHDAGLASRMFQQGIAAFPDDPEMWSGMAAAFLDGDRSKLVEYATQALEFNPRHSPARLLLAEHLIDAEDYAGAEAELARILEVNPAQAEALALRAVLAELRNAADEAARIRAAALATWADNPGVDHLIGRKLSQKYRFAEGSAHQRAALDVDPGFLPARMQLAQDLLRLGREDEGWPLVGQVQQEDGYNVAAFNLVALRDRIEAFTVLTTPHFRLRMSAREAAIYGQRALDILEEGRLELSERYGLELTEPVTVEIYPNPKDFAVRTFGMPDNPGFLGVCFGPVVTINSPATRRANWEAVLWHEFVHVITLTMTRNRMPRWLSEGISVFEETQRDPSWGQRMSLDYRSRILEGRMQPISRMSAAFLEASGGEDLQFAYYQSYLAVRFLVERHGFERLRALLAELGEGTEASAAIAVVYGAAAGAGIDALDAAFLHYARDKARAFGGGLDFTPPGDALAAVVARLNPRNFHARLEQARTAMDSGAWAAAREQLQAITPEGVYVPGSANPHALLARVCREMGDTDAERAALTIVASSESADLEAVERLLVLAEASGDDDAAARWADCWLAINPLAPTPWRALLTARENLDDASGAAAAGQVLLKLDPPDRPAIHFRVARALQKQDADAARLNVLLALEEAPRFRAAHRLLAHLPRTDAKTSNETFEP